jgi:hypothetical protein
MAVLTANGTSSANTAQTITITMPSKRSRIYIRHLTVTTKGADIAGDVDIVVNDNGVAAFPIVLRAGAVYGVNLNFGKGIPIRGGDCTIVIDAGGASVITVAGVIYEIL